MRIKTTRIDWDTDEHKVDLPQQVELEVDHEDEIADELSDEYGWCVHGLAYEIISNVTHSTPTV
jgi:hypothetical protein